MKKTLASIIVVGSVFTAAAYAQSPEESALEPFEKCEGLSEPTERLACFDAALIEAKGLAIANRDERRARTREDFGLTEFDIAKQDVEIADNDPDEINRRRAEREELEPDQIESRLADISQGSASRGRLYILENGQIWQETSPSTLSRSPRVGSSVVISRSGFGGFRLKAGKSRRGIAVKRLK